MKIQDAEHMPRRRKRLPAPGSNPGASLCAWPVAHNEWRIQSRIAAASKYLRSGLKLVRCAWAVCGGHLVIFKVIGTKADAQRVLANVARQLREISTESASGDLPRSGVFIY
jgi:hypothetical protein